MGIISTSLIKRSVKFFVTTILLGIILPGIVHAQATGDFRSRAAGAWNAFATWDRYNGSAYVAATAGQIPDATTDVIIQNGHAVTTSTVAMNCKNLTVGGGTSGSLAVGAVAITVGGTTNIAAGATLTISSATGTKFFTGDFTNNGTWTNSGNSPITFTGNITNNGTFTAGSGAYSFSGISKAINTTNASGLTIPTITWLASYTISNGFTVAKPFASTTITMSNAASSMTNNGVVTIATSLTTSNASALVSNAGTLTVPTLTITSGTVTNTGTVTVSTAINGSGTFNNNNGATLNYGGAGAIAPTLNASANANEVDYTRAGTQTVKGTTYHNLTISGSNTKTLAAAITVNKDLVVTGTATLADATFTITGNASGTFQLGSGAGYTTTRTALNWFPTSTPLANYTLDNNSTVTFGAATTFSLSNNIPSTYGHLIFSGSGTKTLPSSFPITVNGNLTLTTGTLADAGNTITVKGAIASTGTQSGTGKILLSGGSAPHGMQGSGWNYIELDDVQGATLTALLTVGPTVTTGTFVLTNGVVSLNNFNFQMNNSNSSGFGGGSYSSSAMLLQNGTGYFTRYISITAPSTYEFPIGESATEYSPVTINVATNSSAMTYMGFKITDTQHPNDVNTTNYASRYWVAQTAPSTFTYTASFGYTPADVVGTESTFDVFVFDGTNWEYNPATAASNVITYDGPANGFAANDAFVVKAPTSFPSTVTIDGVGGSANTYANLTGATGLFAALNQGVLTGNLTVNVTATPINETGAVALNQVNETGAGAGTYTVTIQSNNSTQKVFDGNYSGPAIGTNGLIRLSGADRVTFNGGTGTDRRLLFRNNNALSLASVFHFLNDASDNKINNCTIEGSIGGNITSAIQGLVYIGAGVTTGNDNIIITNNDIKQAGSTTPSNGVSTDGTSATVQNNSGEVSNNNIYNIHRATVDNAAIHIAGNSPGWTISGNKIYQESARTGVSSTNYGVYFSTTTSNGTLIDNNVIGYANSSSTGNTSFNTLVSNGAARFEGIYLNGSSTGTLSTITNNIIDNISLTTTSGGSSTVPVFSGIFLNGGKYLVDGNYIGATSGVASSTNGINIVTTTNNTTSTSPAAIIANTTSTSQTISNNHIGAVAMALSSGTLALNFHGIKVVTGSVNVQGNEIGNATANSFLLSNPGTGSAIVSGIWGNTGSGFSVSITGNTIQNIASSNTLASTTSQTAGINASGAGNYTVDGNTISNLTSNSQSVSSTVPAVVGITATPGGSLSHSVSGNTIYALSNTSVANTVVTGIYFTGNALVSQINKNFIYNLRSGTGTASVINGIHIGNSTAANVSNNRIRLGYDETGLPIINTSFITGILKDNTTTGNSVYYNSVYIGGTGVNVTANNTYAFRRLQTSLNDNVRNNIFVNARSNAAGGGKHYGLYLISTPGLTEDYNLIYAPGTGGVLASVNGTDQTTMAAWKSANSGLDVSSVSADPQFEDPTNATAPNLKLKTTVATPAESGAIAIAGLTDDFEATNVRTGYPLGLPQGGTAPDMGADEANLLPKDLLPPVITLTPISTISTGCGSNPTVTVTATVTDAGSGVATASLAPTLWWRLSTGTYASLLPSSVSGSTYTYSLSLTGVTAGQVYQYYIAAQDAASPANISYSSGAPVHADVSATPSSINSSPSSVTVISTTPLSGTVNVGTGQTYTTLSGASGLFAAINTNGISGNLNVIITSNTTETGANALNQVSEFCGSGYTITIMPDGTTTRVLSGTYTGTNGIITLNGADRVVIDGQFGGDGLRHLHFHNTSAGFSATSGYGTLYLINDATNNSVSNCIVEGHTHANSSGTLTGGVVMLGIASSTGNNNNTFDHNLITGTLSGGGADGASCLLFSQGSSSFPNSNITVTNNEFKDFSVWNSNMNGSSTARCYGIHVTAVGNGSNWNITGNSFYTTFPENQGMWTALSFQPGGASNNNTISGNFIGGSDAMCGSCASCAFPYMGQTLAPSTYETQYQGMLINSGTVSVSDNTIKRIWIRSTQYSGFVGIYVQGSTNATITRNSFGGTGTQSFSVSTSSDYIQVDGGGLAGGVGPGYIYGIWSQNNSTVTVDDNTFNTLFQTGNNSANGGLVQCIYHSGTGPAVITNNHIDNPNAAGKNYSSYAIRLQPTASTSGNVISGNIITGPSVLGAATVGGVRADAVYVNIGSGLTVSGKIEQNKIYALNSVSTAGWIDGVYITNTGTTGAGDWDINNNTIQLDNRSNTAGVMINGINIQLNSGSTTKVNYNSVYVAGSTVNNSAYNCFAFWRYPGGSGASVGDNCTLSNNILVNTRTAGASSTAFFGAIANQFSSGVSQAGYSSDRNLVLNNPSTQNILGVWQTSVYNTLSLYQAAAGNTTDANSYTATYTSGSSNFSSGALNPQNLFTNPALGNLHINTTDNESYKFVSNRGAANSVTTDFDGDARTSTPDLGADEFFICATPVVSSNTPTNPTCVGGNGSIALSGLTASTTYAVTYNKNGTPVASANFTTNGSGVLTIGSLGAGAYNNFVVTIAAGCASAAYPSSGNITLTDPVTPTISSNTPTNPTCVGGDGSIALSGLANSTTYSVTYNKNGTPVAAANFTSNGSGVVTVGSLSAGAYTDFVLTPVGGCASTAYPSSGNITLTAPVCGANTWQGDVIGSVNDWFNAGNWSNNVVPNSCSADAVIPTSPIGGNNFPILNASSASVGNITVQDGATIAINSGRTLSVCGNWTGGTTSPSTVTGVGSVILTGSTAQAVSGRTAFTTLHVTKTGGSTATLQANSFIDVTTAVELESGTLATGTGTLTFKSTGTNQIAVLDNFTAGYTGTLTGNITAERYYNATGTTNQHYMGSPVSTTLSQFGAGSSSGFVTPTATCSETQLASTSVYGSVFSYDQANGASCSLAGWKVEAGATAVAAAKGFAVTKNGAGTVTVTGAPNLASSYTQAGTNSGWSNSSLQGRPMTAGWVLVSNPYLAYLDFSTQGAPANFTSEVKVWRTTGAFAGTYQDLQPGEMIAPFQGFFVHSNATGSYPISGAKRTRSTAGSFHAQANDQQLSITAANTTTGLADITMVAFNNDATTQFDNDYDAQKIAGTLGRHTLYTVGANNLWMSKNVLHDIATTSTVTMGFEPEVSGSYTFSFEGLNSFDPTSYITLEDRKLNTFYDVRNGDYNFTADSADQWERFVLHFTPAAQITTTDENCNALGNIIVTQPGTANWNYTITDNNNATIASGTLNETTPINAAAQTGTYVITLVDNNNYTVAKTVTVSGTGPLAAVFTPSVTVAETNQAVSFNSSSVATNYYWDFGDGTTATGQNAIHNYSDTGTYTVTLIVISEGGCSSTTTQTITVNQTATGITTLNNKAAINIWSNENKVYIDFSQMAKTDATIAIYNVLGQELVNEKFARSTIYNKALLNTEAAYVIVKVKNGDAVITKKVFIANVK